jgi:hypothetical protein
MAPKASLAVLDSPHRLDTSPPPGASSKESEREEERKKKLNFGPRFKVYEATQ